MGIAFLTATIAILFGAKNLDRASEKRNHDESSAPADR